MFITNDKVNVTGIVLAGSADFKNVLAGSECFDQRLVAKIMKTVDVSYGGENGFNQAIELCAETPRERQVRAGEEADLQVLRRSRRTPASSASASTTPSRAREMRERCARPGRAPPARPSARVCPLSLALSLSLSLSLSRSLGTLSLSLSGEEVLKLMAPEQEADFLCNFVTSDGIELETVERMTPTEWFANNYKTFGATLEFGERLAGGRAVRRGDSAASAASCATRSTSRARLRARTRRTAKR